MLGITSIHSKSKVVGWPTWEALANSAVQEKGGSDSWVGPAMMVALRAPIHLADEALPLIAPKADRVHRPSYSGFGVGEARSPRAASWKVGQPIEYGSDCTPGEQGSGKEQVGDPNKRP